MTEKEFCKKRVVLATALVVDAIAIAVLLHPAVRYFAESNAALHSLYLTAMSFSISCLLVPIAMKLGPVFGLVDHPDEARKKHLLPTPLTGGLAIYLSFVITILLNFHFSNDLKVILISASVIFVMGLLDDRFDLSAKVRLAVQCAVALYLVYSGIRVTFVPNALGGEVVEAIITIVWILGITNSMNFIDGMDGIAAGTSIVCAVFFAVIAVITKQYYMMFLAVAVAGSCLGFFFYNFRKGKSALVFLGDSGATFLGFVLACFAILGDWGDSIIDIGIPVLIMSVLIFDMTLTTIVRIANKEVRSFSQWLHYTGRDHFHHRLLDLGMGSKPAAFLYFLVSVCFGMQALTLLLGGLKVGLLVLAQSIIAFAILGVILVRKGRKKESRLPS